MQGFFGFRVAGGTDERTAPPPESPTHGKEYESRSAKPSAEALGGLSLDIGDGVTIELALIPAGEFVMGSPDSETGRDADEVPQHKVTIVKPFYMSRHEVTQAQWLEVMANNPSHFRGNHLPVETVSWKDAQDFCKKVSEKTGRAIRLPTEAEWEYACRAETKTQFSYGDDADRLVAYAWYEANSNDYTHPVGQKEPNPWGLFDMHGNVREWCADRWNAYSPLSPPIDPFGPPPGCTGLHDCFEGVLRGGSWNDTAPGCRCANRFKREPGDPSVRVGFRIVVAAD